MVNWNLVHSDSCDAFQFFPSFEEVVFYISNDFVLDIVPHPNPNKYPGQRMFIINIDNYAYLVPFIEENEIIYLKTIIPSRKATKKYLKGW